MIGRGLDFRTLLLCGLTACGGHTVDLDGAGANSASPQGNEPPVVSNTLINGVWVDDQRLFWLAGSGEEYGTFESCLKGDCEHTRQRYVAGIQWASDAAVGDGYVYWTRLEAILSCDVNGCSGKPTTVVQGSGHQRIFANRGYVYWPAEPDLYRCRSNGCSAIPEVVAINTHSVTKLAFAETHAYWVDSAGTSILAAPADGSELPKLVIELPPESAAIAALAARNGYLYWTVSEQLFKCSIAACSVSTATLLTVAEAPIQDLKADDSGLFWLA